MKIISFKDLIVWQKARIVTVIIYKLFADCRDYAFRDQIRRASVSVLNNIAEGFGRRNDKEFNNFLRLAKASCVEVESMLFLTEDLEYLNKLQVKDLLEKIEEIGRMLHGLRKKVNKFN